MLKLVARDSLVYLIFSAATVLISLAVLPLFDVMFSASDFGKFAVFQTLIVVSGPILGLGANTLMRSEIVLRSRHEANEIIGNALIIPFITGGVLVLLTIIITPLFVKTGLTNERSWPVIAVAVAAFNTIISYVSSVYQARRHIVSHGVISFFVPLVTNAIGLFLVFIFVMDWYGRAYGMVLGTGLVALIVTLRFCVTQDIWPRWNSESLTYLVKGGLRLIPQGIAMTLLRRTDLLMVSAMTSMAGTGQYSIAIQVAGLVSMVCGTIQKSLEVHFLNVLKKMGRPNLSFVILVYACVLLSFACFSLVIVCVANFAIVSYLDDDLHKAVEFVPYLAFAAVLQSLQASLTVFLIFTKKTGSIAPIYMSAVFVNITLNLILIPTYGVIGAAYATACVSGGALILQIANIIRVNVYSKSKR